MQRRVLVTGAASGIGRAIAERLAADGHRVLGSRPAARPGRAGRAVRGGSGDPRREPRRLSRLRSSASAGSTRSSRTRASSTSRPVEEFPDERWDSLLAVLLTSPFLLAKHAWKALGESGDGRFLAVASVHGLVASPYKAGYVAAKHGLLGLVKVLALEGAEHGICVAALCPGYVRTPIVEAQIEAQARATGVAPERVLEDVLLAPQAIKRLLEPDEVAETAAFLLGPGGRAFTGAPVVMDLGWTAR